MCVVGGESDICSSLLPFLFPLLCPLFASSSLSHSQVTRREKGDGRRGCDADAEYAANHGAAGKLDAHVELGASTYDIWSKLGSLKLLNCVQK